MKRLSDQEKKHLGILIHYYRIMYFRSEVKNAEEFKQINFCKNICSQAQLSRLENGEFLKKQEIYEALLNKLNLSLEKVSLKEYSIFETYFENILLSQNNDDLAINYNEYVFIINKYQNVFKKNIICTHFNYVLEFILAVLNNDIEDASFLIKDIENTIDILQPKFLSLALQYMGRYYHLTGDYNNATKYYLLSIEHMHKYKINNQIIYLETAYNYLKNYQYIYALDYLNKALDMFQDTNNFITIAKIYKNYGLVYLSNTYYDDGINFLIKALEYSKKANKNKLVQEIYNIYAVGLYLKKEYLEALSMLNKSLLISHNEGNLLLNYLINLRINKKVKIILTSQYYLQIYNFYQKINKEEDYEKIVKPILNHLPDSIVLIILYDVLHYYIENKKYKKVAEFVRNYL